MRPYLMANFMDRTLGSVASMRETVFQMGDSQSEIINEIISPPLMIVKGSANLCANRFTAFPTWTCRCTAVASCQDIAEYR